MHVKGMEFWHKKASFRYIEGSFPDWCLIANKEGKFMYSIDGKQEECCAGEILIIPPNTKFKREIVEPLSFFLVAFIFVDEPSMERERTLHLLAAEFHYKFVTPEQDRLYNNFRHLRSLYEDYTPFPQKEVAHFINDIWLLYYVTAKKLIENQHIIRDPLMKQAKDWMDEHAFQVDFKMKEVAGLFDLHPVQFTRRFQKVFGLPPSHYLFSVRMERAKSLLMQTDYTLDHIAQLCGYDNGYYFSRMFTQYTKMNPSSFRKIYAMPAL